MPRHYLYHFEQVDSINANSPLRFKIEKRAAESPRDIIATYHLWGSDDTNFICDCPAAKYRGELDAGHKHTAWLIEWRDLNARTFGQAKFVFSTLAEGFVEVCNQRHP